MKLKDVIHYYLGCDCMVMGEEVAAKIKSVWHDGLVGVDYNGIGETEHVVEDVFPILRPLSSITEEEAKQLVRIISPTVFGYPSTIFIAKKDRFGFEWKDRHDRDESHAGSGDIQYDELNSTQFHYLVSIGIDLFRLIDSEQAIDITKLNKDAK